MVGRLLALVVPLGIDSFVVAAALGLQRPSRRERLRVSLVFSLFEGLMPFVGVLLGRPLGSLLGDAADYVAVVVLMGLGSYSVFAKERTRQGRLDSPRPEVQGPSRLAWQNGEGTVRRWAP